MPVICINPMVDPGDPLIIQEAVEGFGMVELALESVGQGSYHLTDPSGTGSEHTLSHLLEALEEAAIGGKGPQTVW